MRVPEQSFEYVGRYRTGNGAKWHLTHCGITRVFLGGGATMTSNSVTCPLCSW